MKDLPHGLRWIRLRMPTLSQARPCPYPVGTPDTDPNPCTDLSPHLIVNPHPYFELLHDLPCVLAARDPEGQRVIGAVDHTQTRGAGIGRIGAGDGIDPCIARVSVHLTAERMHV